MLIRLLTAGLFLVSVTFVAYGQTREEKTAAIISQWDLIRGQKTNYKYRLEPLKYQATGNDSIRIIRLEKQLSDEEIGKKVSSAFNETFSEAEITTIYEFIQTSAFEKFFKSGEIYQVILSKFKDIDEEIQEITGNISKQVEPPIKKFIPVPVDKEDGFYETVDYTFETADKDLKLADNPSLSLKDIQEVKKVFNSYNNRPEISIEFTKDGAGKFYTLTRDNIGKPIAIVIAKQIVSIPKVKSEITNGKASISGDFSEKEIDKMIETLGKK